jgi:hypothetical protein
MREDYGKYACHASSIKGAAEKTIEILGTLCHRGDSITDGWSKAVLWIRIQIQIGSGFNGVPESVSGFGIRIRI